MSATITKCGALASSFPAAEVAYEDLLLTPYTPNGRTLAGLDCMGVVLEIYRRAGIKLPDPLAAGGSIFEFTELFQEITDTSTIQLYDLVGARMGDQHVGVVVRPGLVLDASEKRNVCCLRVNVLKQLGRRWWRVRSACLPA